MLEARWTGCAALAVTLGAAASGCASPIMGDDVATVRIERLDAPEHEAGREWRPADSQLVATLVKALHACGDEEMVKFRPSRRVVVTRKDGAERTVLVLGDLLKIDGVAFKCREDVGALVDRMWREGTERR